jgi:hypothetical protein
MTREAIRGGPPSAGEAADHVRGPKAGRLLRSSGVRRDVERGTASGQVRGTPTLLIDGTVHLGGYDAATLMEALEEDTHDS